VITSSAEPLVDRVLDGTFHHRLFYLLNVIHLDMLQH
jgi:DNA-binding NtrC family response regulator